MSYAMLRRATALLATLFASAAAHAVSLETDTMVGLMAKTNPKVLERKSVESFARHVWCHEYLQARNEFEREDYLQALTKRMSALAQSSFGTIKGIRRSFNFFEYDFKNEAMQINRGQYDWARTAPVGSFLSNHNRPCWQNLGNMFGFTPIVEALPEWGKAVPFNIKIPQEEARNLYANGRPTVELTFSMKVESYTVEPMGNPKIIFRGHTTEWELVLYDGTGNEIRRFESSPVATAAQTAPASALGVRVVVDVANVRAEPTTVSSILTKLTPGEHITVEKQTPNGEWSYVIVPDDAVGWVNTPVLLRTTRPAQQAPETAALASPAPDASTLQRHMTFLTTGIDGPPFVLKEEFHNALNTHIKTVTHTYEPELTGPCELRLKYTSRGRHHGSKPQIDLDNWDATYRFDFTKLTRIDAKYSDQPEEGIWHGFAGGHNNPRMRKPRKITILDYFGENAVCRLRERGDDTCTTADRSDGHRFFANPAKRPKDFQDAFKAIKAVCR